MTSQERRRANFFIRVRQAISGIGTAFRHERNLKIHTVFAIIVIIAAWGLRVSRQDWILLLFLIAAVICLELVNTAVERAVDLITQDEHPLAKQAKDIAAGAVLVMAIASAIIGCIIFIKYL